MQEFGSEMLGILVIGSQLEVRQLTTTEYYEHNRPGPENSCVEPRERESLILDFHLAMIFIDVWAGETSAG